MADTSTTPNKNGLLYAIIGALVVVVAGGGFYLYKMDTATPLMPSPIEAAKPVPPPPPPPVATPRPTPPPPAAPAGPSAAQINQARSYSADARHFAGATRSAWPNSTSAARSPRCAPLAANSRP